MIIHGDSLDRLKELDDDSIDFVCTDPPYGYSFMGKDWDKAVPSVEIWQECLRVLKPGAFMCVMSAPRSDVQNAMISRLMEAGFRLDFTPIYWTYASGFPKAGNIGKLVDKRLGTERKITGPNPYAYKGMPKMTNTYKGGEMTKNPLSAPSSPQAKALDGSYAGFQPKPAVEVIIVAMKPLSEKTYVNQALANGKGISWLDNGRIPTGGEQPKGSGDKTLMNTGNVYKGGPWTGNTGNVTPEAGRFPANILVSDGILGEHSKYFNLDEWSDNEKISMGVNTSSDMASSHNGQSLPDNVAGVLPFLITPKASKSEKNKGLEHLSPKAQATMSGGNGIGGVGPHDVQAKANHHPTVKPLKLMSYLITLFSRPGDTVLDPFCGSGSTNVAAHNLGRETIGIKREAEYVEIARARLAHVKPEIVQLLPEKPEPAVPPVTLESLDTLDQASLF